MKTKFTTILLTAIFSLACTRTYELVVVGGGTGGTAAGIQAARLGTSTLIVSETEWLGGMLTSAGVGAVDGNYNLRGGIFAEFCDSLAARYGGYDSLKTGWVSHVMFEPSVGASVLENIAAAQPHLEVLKGYSLESITRDEEYWKLIFRPADSLTDLVSLDNNSTAVFPTRMGKKVEIRAKVVIDGTELGDAMKLAGVRMRSGMDSRAETHEGIAPEEHHDIVQDLTWVAVLKDFGQGGGNVSVEKPADYDPSLYRDCCRHDGNTPGAEPLWSVTEMLDYGRLPSGEYMLNWPIFGNDFYANVLDMTPQERQLAYQAAKNRTLGFIYYIQTELGLSHIGISDDEFPTSDGLALIPYHREASRICGDVLFTVDAAARPYDYELYRTGIAVGDYAVDHHHDRYDGSEKLPDIHFYPIPSFSVPMGALIPSDAENLIAADKCISVSNIMNGATRLQPVIMQVGQAAGVLAALSVSRGVPVSQVGVRDVQQCILENGGYIQPYIGLKPGDEGFEAVQRIGATGILKAQGRNEGWTNVTDFRENDSLTWEEVAEGLSVYYPKAASYAGRRGGVVSRGELQGLFEVILPGRCPEFLTDVSAKISAKTSANDSVSRLEFAVLLDSLADPFGSLPVDILGRCRTHLVNPLIGSGGHGHVFVGANVPHGMISVGPNNISTGWDWCSGYHDSDTTIAGFAQNHLSGTGIADFGEILLMPFSGKYLRMEKGTGRGDGYAEPFDKSEETVRPGYYSVKLKNSGIQAQMTASEHVALHRYIWPEAEDYGIFLNLESAPKSIESRAGYIDSGLKKISNRVWTGYRTSDEWARGLTVHFALEFSTAPHSVLMTDSLRGGIFYFEYPEVEAKVALSYESEKKALANLEQVRGKSFETVCTEASGKWSAELSSIEFKGIVPEIDTIFHTALYHTAFAPQLYSDAGQTEKYTVFSLWDIYRAAWQLYSLTDPRAADYVRSLLDIESRTGRLPVWHLAGIETDCMVGVHSVPVIADAAIKGLVPLSESWAAVSHWPEQPATQVPGLEYIDSLGYIPADKVNWSVSRALEYCIDDAAAARLAEAVGDSVSASYLDRRAGLYRNYFHEGFMRGRLSDGSWRTPFDPAFSLHEEADYVEGNAWQYTWLVPHDVEGLMELFSGKDAFADALDKLFEADSKLNEGASADITGMLGQYAHGNEPSHHIAYLYTLAGRPEKTADLVRKICTEFYTTAPDGLIGNEDCGQMSAWYVFSAIGFYPVDPVGGFYVFGSPLCTEAVIRTATGKDFRIVVRNNSLKNKYIGRILLNGEPYHGCGISHESIVAGGCLEFEMTSDPKKAFVCETEFKEGNCL